MMRSLLLAIAVAHVMSLDSEWFGKKKDEQPVYKKPTGKPKVEYWYVNMKDATARATCVEKQLKEAGIDKVNRFQAIELLPLCENEFGKCLEDRGYGDCISGGIDWEGTSTHGRKGADDWAIHHNIVSNWCGHKRLFQQLADRGLEPPPKKNNTSFLEQLTETPDEAEYFVVLEDDVIVDQTWFKSVIEDFLENYDGKMHNRWDLVQIDPFGDNCDSHIIDRFRGKSVWKPEEGPCPIWEQITYKNRMGDYWGFQAIIVRRAALNNLVKWMSEHKTVPVDWLPVKMPGAIAFKGDVANNPEARRFGWYVERPNYCDASVFESEIGANLQASEPEESTPTEFLNKMFSKQAGSKKMQFLQTATNLLKKSI